MNLDIYFIDGSLITIKELGIMLHGKLNVYTFEDDGARGFIERRNVKYIIPDALRNKVIIHGQ